jgi:hypothetical protein
MRAGERTRLIVADKPVPAIRFRATVLDGEPEGRVEIERRGGGALRETAPLAPENLIDGAELAAISVVPVQDSAITLLPLERPAMSPAVIGGMALVAGAIAWTVYDFLGL